MGWLWNSTAPEKAPAPQADKEAVPPPTSTASSTSNSSAASNQSSDPEIEKFLELLNAKSEPSDSTSSSSQKPSDQSSISSWFSVGSVSRTAKPAIAEAPVGNDLSESLLPADMSCRQAFDQAWACNSMGGQWNAVYRYGEMRSCSEHWDDFWFCMRTRSHGPEMREKLIRAHYRNKEYAKYGDGKPNSEDIWQSREEKVEPGTVFTEPIE